MAIPETGTILARIRESIRVEKFYPPPLRPLFEPDGRRLHVPMTELLAAVERKLGVPMPLWLREVYQTCNGFSGPYDVCILYPLDGNAGVGDFTLFLRDQDWSPPWLTRAIVFGFIAGSGSTTAHSVALDGQLIEWCYGDGDKYRVLEGGLFELWRRIQARWDAVGRTSAGAERNAAADQPGD
jgi:hypothetical protein